MRAGDLTDLAGKNKSAGGNYLTLFVDITVESNPRVEQCIVIFNIVSLENSLHLH